MFIKYKHKNSHKHKTKNGKTKKKNISKKRENIIHKKSIKKQLLLKSLDGGSSYQPRSSFKIKGSVGSQNPKAKGFSANNGIGHLYHIKSQIDKKASINFFTGNQTKRAQLKQTSATLNGLIRTLRGLPPLPNTPNMSKNDALSVIKGLTSTQNKNSSPQPPHISSLISNIRNHLSNKTQLPFTSIRALQDNPALEAQKVRDVTAERAAFKTEAQLKFNALKEKWKSEPSTFMQRIGKNVFGVNDVPTFSTMSDPNMKPFGNPIQVS